MRKQDIHRKGAKGTNWPLTILFKNNPIKTNIPAIKKDNQIDINTPLNPSQAPIIAVRKESPKPIAGFLKKYFPIFIINEINKYPEIDPTK